MTQLCLKLTHSCLLWRRAPGCALDATRSSLFLFCLYKTCRRTRAFDSGKVEGGRKECSDTLATSFNIPSFEKLRFSFNTDTEKINYGMFHNLCDRSIIAFDRSSVFTVAYRLSCLGRSLLFLCLCPGILVSYH